MTQPPDEHLRPSLADYGFDFPRSGLARDASGAAHLAEQFGFPVALKIQSPDILHKTDVGGVVLDLRDGEAVRQAFDAMMGTIAERAPGARIEGATVEEMAPDGVEVIIGLLNDPQFGPAIMFGLGGIFAEVLRDVRFRLLPLSERDAREMVDEVRGQPVLDGYRGAPAASKALLVDLLMRAARLGLDLGDRLEAVDLNPVRVRGDRHWVLDAKVILKEPAGARTPPAEPHTAHLEGFFSPRSVALVGASATPGKVGHAVLDSLLGEDFAGEVYPINPGRAELMGVRCWPSLSAIPGTVDLVVVTVALGLVPALLRECAAKGVRNMVIVSGGGKELDAAADSDGAGEPAVPGLGKDVEAEIKRLARELDVRVIGPNCIGVFDGVSRLDTFFQVRERMLRPSAGPIAILSQSGTVGAAVLEEIAGIGVSRFVSYGNRVDVDEADLAAYLGDDPQTKVLAYYVEGLAEGRKFASAVAQVTPFKPVVIFKPGRTPRAAQASMSHTGFFGGTYALAEGAFRQAGMITVDSIEELSAAARALALQPAARGGRVAMISNGAGTMVQAMDLLEGYDLEMAELSPETLERLRAAYPPYYLVQNPVDVTGSATSTDYEVGVEALLADPGVDIVMPWFVFQDTPLGEDIVEKLGRLSGKRQSPILCGAMGGPYTARMGQALEAVGVPVFGSVREWVAAAGALARRGRVVRGADRKRLEP